MGLLNVLENCLVQFANDTDAAIERIRTQAPETIKKMEANARVLIALAGNHPDDNIRKAAERRFNYNHIRYGTNFHLGTFPEGDVSGLTVVRKLVGELKFKGDDVADPDMRKRLINVTMQAVDAPDITFTYTTRLPKDKAIKCRMVKETYKSTRLVCQSE